jgi:hypothetical protein
LGPTHRILPHPQLWSQLLLRILKLQILLHATLHLRKLFHFELWSRGGFLLILLFVEILGCFSEGFSVLFHVVNGRLPLSNQLPSIPINWIQEILNGVSLHVPVFLNHFFAIIFC